VSGVLIAKVTLTGLRLRAALVVVAAAAILSSVSPAVADDNHNATPNPDATSSAQPATHFHHGDDGDVNKREHELQARYGHDRDISTPPLIVKQSMTSGKFVTKAIHVKHLDSGVATSDVAKASVPTKPISVAGGRPVVKGLQPSSFESPATQFMNFTYLAMGLIAVVLVALAIGVSSTKDRLNR
jgi:hypothetical protein